MNAVIVGLGRMGQRHVGVIRAVGLELAGVCDQNPLVLSEFGGLLDIPAQKRYDDFAIALKKVSPECVIIATTAPTHCEYTCMAAEAGAKYILCEKPMAVSLEECDKMLDVCEKYGATLAINHQMRFMEQYTIPKKLLQSEEFGGLKSITVVAGNFGMAMNGTHYFEMLRYMTDDSPMEVAAWFSPEDVPNPRGPQFLDKAGSVRVITKTGKRYYMDISSDQGHGMLAVYATRNGRIVVDELSGEMKTAVREAEHRDLPTTRYGMPYLETNIRIAPADVITPSKDVLDALLKGDNYPNGEDGRKAVEVLVAAYVSHEQAGRTVKLSDEPLPRERKFPWA